MSISAGPSVGNEMFLHNMRALWRHDPALALRVDAVPDEQRISIEPARSGAWTAKMPTPDGQATYLHSRYDPHAEGHRKYFDPHAVDLLVDRVAGFQPAPLHHRQPTGQTDGKGRKNDMKGNREGELNPRQHYRI